VEIRFDYAHTGALSGFTFQVQWGASTINTRDASAADALLTGRADAAVGSSTTQLSAQSWGTVLPMGAAVGTTAEALNVPLTIVAVLPVEVAEGLGASWSEALRVGCYI
jgi:hypothetical protein